jgi:hypothetical protein
MPKKIESFHGLIRRNSRSLTHEQALSKAFTSVKDLSIPYGL